MLRLENVQNPATWNQLVTSLPITSALQSWGWGEVKHGSGWQPLRLAVWQDGSLVAAAQILRRQLGGPFWMAYCPRGPALLRLDLLPQVAQALRPALRGAIYLKLEAEQPLYEPFATPAFGGLRQAETIQPEYSIWLNLAEGEKAVLDSMSSMHRRNTRLAQKRVQINTAGPEAFEAFWGLFEETNRRAKLLQHAQSYYRRVLSAMQQPCGEAFISLAALDGQPLAAGLMVAFAGKVDYLYGGSSRHNPEVKAPNGMHWGAIAWGLEHGYHTYDLWGVPRQTEGSHAAGIDKFKEGFGGLRVRFPAYDLPLSPLYIPLTTALRWRKSWLNYRMRGSTRDVLG